MAGETEQPAFVGLTSHEPDLNEARESEERIDKATNELLKVVPGAGLIYQKVISFKKSGKGSSLTFTQNNVTLKDNSINEN